MMVIPDPFSFNASPILYMDGSNAIPHPINGFHSINHPPSLCFDAIPHIKIC